MAFREAFQEFVILRLLTYLLPFLIIAFLWVVGLVEGEHATNLATGMLDVPDANVWPDELEECRPEYKQALEYCDKTGTP